MSRIAVLARADHPAGWGAPGVEKCDMGQWHFDNTRGTAHGYSILLVRCATDDEEAALVERLAQPVTGIFGSEWWDSWFGGRFDLLAWIDTGPRHGEPVVTDRMGNLERSRSIGDNRYLGVLGVKQLLDASNRQPTQGKGDK